MKKVIQLVLVYFIPAFSYAQLQPTQKDVDTALKRGRQEVKSTLYSSNGRSTILNPVSNFSISSQFEKGTSGKVDLKLPFDKNEWTQLNLSAEQKITSGSTEATPFNLEGISPNSTISIGLQSMLWRPKPTSRAFKEYYQEIGLDFLKRNHRPETDINNLMKGEFDAEALNKLGRQTIRQPLFFNIKASFSKSNFKYSTDSITFKGISENKLNTSLSASIIKFLCTNSLQQILSLNFKYEDYYTSGDSKDFLMQFGTTANYVSNNVVFGPPKHSFDKLISLEYKMGKINESNIFLFGLAPSATYSIQEKNLAFQMPFYFLPTKDEKGNLKSLNGGISFGYLTSTKNGKWTAFKDGFAFELFIGLPFKVFE